MKPQLIVALDVETLAEVRELVEKLDEAVDIYKIGSQLFTACGPAAVRFVQARGKKVFLDLKFHDIPNTVASAVTSAVGLHVAVERSTDKKSSHQGLFMITLHTVGGVEMMKAAVAAASKAAKECGVPSPLLVGVTVLTSDGGGDKVLPLVLERARLAKQAGMSGGVASCHEAAAIRKEMGKDFVIVTPGIRPSGEAVQDQKRVATPAEAVKSGSSFMVVGRPIVQAENPLQAAKKILQEI